MATAMTSIAIQKKTKFYSPESAVGSFVFSIAVHTVLYGSIALALGLTLGHHDVPEAVNDVSYEIFDAPPDPTKEVHRVQKSAEPEAAPQPKAVVDNTPKEIQDEKSDIAGTQKAAPVANIGSDSNGTAATTPYYKIKPKYPRAALVNGTEGWVLLQIDINETGAVENVRVIDGEQRNMFQSEARRAVEQWKYKPFLDQAGKPFKKTDHQVRVDFKLNEVNEASM